jgi:glycosyltransferase involved in cell wall biosynthesis
MKIALVVPGGVDRSGTERVIPILLWLIERLVRAGDEVHVFALNQEPKPGQWQLLGAAVHNAGRHPQRLRSLLSIFREHRRRRFDVIHAFWAGAPGQVACAFGMMAGVPIAVTLPGGDLASIPEIGYGAQLRWRSRVAIRFVLSRVSAILVPSHWLADHARAQGWRPIVCPFGVALDHWPPAEPRQRRASEPLRLIHVASLNRVKDPFGLLDAMKLLANDGVDFELEMIGEDTLGGPVQDHCCAISLQERVRFRGFVPTADLRAEFEQADLLVMNSLHEGAPIAMLEAAVAGVPTVGTRVGNIADWAPDASIAVPVNDPPALADAIAELAADEPKRLRLATAAHARALAHDADRYAARLRGIFAKLANELPAERTAPMEGVRF